MDRIPYNQRTRNKFSFNYKYNQLNNDYDLQKRIDKSLYPRYFLNKKTQQYRSPTINNISDYNNDSNNYDLMEDFKNTLKKTQQLQNELMNNNNFYKANYNNYKYNLNLDTDSKKSSEELDSDYNNIEILKKMMKKKMKKIL